MKEILKLDGLQVDVTIKDIKNIHLSVYPPAGKVRISAPKHMRPSAIKAFVLSQLDWIRKQWKSVIEQDRETRRDYVSRESHYLWGERYLLKVVELNDQPRVQRKHSQLVLQVRPRADWIKRHDLMSSFYRNELRTKSATLISNWEPQLGVSVSRLFVQQMKTQWGSCNPMAGNIRLNVELAKKPVECLEYILVHEMIHLIEPTHSQRFVKLMNRYMPQWSERREALNRLPVKHEDWRY